MTPNLATYWHTLRHLRPIQIFGRIWFRFYRPKFDSTPPLAARCFKLSDWKTPATRRASLIGPEHFRFLNETHSLSEHGWDNALIDRLWRYNLHYFDDLNARSAATRADWHIALLSRWVADNPPTLGTGWEPYPTSIRIVNWIKWALSGNTLPHQCIESLALQAHWLAGRLEYHLLGNHLFANAKALVFAGLFFEGPTADRWLDTGLDILKRQIPEQILADGGQFELSTMYHALALEDMLDLINLATTFDDAIPLNQKSTAAHLGDKIAPMRHWLAAMTHPDGEISFYNDAAIGIAPSPKELENYASRLGFPVHSARKPSITHLATSGYIRVTLNQAVALLDVARIGPDYLPAHAHADTLSFELSLYDQRVLVNTGTSGYTQGVDRSYQRGTAAHNTVVINNQNSSETWASFRVGRRARPINLTISDADDPIVSCGHDGYHHLPGKPSHQRRWLFSKNMLLIDDQISGKFDRAQARFHLHPGIQLENTLNDTQKTLLLPHGEIVQFSIEGGTLRTEETTWHPEFGIGLPNQCLVIEIDGARLRTQITWQRKK